MPQVWATYSEHRDCPEHLRRSVWRNHFARHITHGDSQPAVCVTVLVAAYSIDIDCVTLLVFPDEFAQRYCLHTGKRLDQREYVPERRVRLRKRPLAGPARLWFVGKLYSTYSRLFDR